MACHNFRLGGALMGEQPAQIARWWPGALTRRDVNVDDRPARHAGFFCDDTVTPVGCADELSSLRLLGNGPRLASLQGMFDLRHKANCVQLSLCQGPAQESRAHARARRKSAFARGARGARGAIW